MSAKKPIISVDEIRKNLNQKKILTSLETTTTTSSTNTSANSGDLSPLKKTVKKKDTSASPPPNAGSNFASSLEQITSENILHNNNQNNNSSSNNSHNNSSNNGLNLSSSNNALSGVSIANNNGGSIFKDRYVDLAAFCEEVLAYCSLIDDNRNTANMTIMATLSEINEITKINDEYRSREKEHLAQLEQDRMKCAELDKDFKDLKYKAAQKIKQAEENRDAYKTELINLKEKSSRLEAELMAATASISSQKAELEQLREVKKRSSENENATELRLKVRNLENENGMLRTERATNLHRLDELQGQLNRLQKSSGNSANPNNRQQEQIISQLKRDLKAQEEESDKLRDYVESLCQQLEAYERPLE